MVSKLERHPLSAAWPDIPESEQKELLDDVRQNGLFDSQIVIYEGRVLDGWHRYKAAVAIGLDESAIQVVALEDMAPAMTPFDYVRSKNDLRRHITKVERGKAVARMNEYLAIRALELEAEAEAEIVRALQPEPEQEMEQEPELEQEVPTVTVADTLAADAERVDHLPVIPVGDEQEPEEPEVEESPEPEELEADELPEPEELEADEDIAEEPESEIPDEVEEPPVADEEPEIPDEPEVKEPPATDRPAPPATPKAGEGNPMDVPGMPTIEEMAEQAGVSKSTMQRAVHEIRIERGVGNPDSTVAKPNAYANPRSSDEMDAEIATLTSRVSDLEEMILERDSQILLLAEDNEALGSQIHLLKADADPDVLETLDSMKHLQADNLRLQAELEACNQQRDSWMERYEVERRRASALQAEIDNQAE